MKYLFFFTIIFIGQRVQAQDIQSIQSPNPEISQELISKIKLRGTTWSKALKEKKVVLLKDLYDENAQYLPNNAKAHFGREDIVAYWAASMDFIEDIQLNMETLDGNSELLYETGKGIAKVMDANGAFIEMAFKYVNVWKFQDDGSYRVVIDIFNNPAANE